MISVKRERSGESRNACTKSKELTDMRRTAKGGGDVGSEKKRYAASVYLETVS